VCELEAMLLIHGTGEVIDAADVARFEPYSGAAVDHLPQGVANRDRAVQEETGRTRRRRESMSGLN
jgi:hypothetical protein